MFQQGSKAYIQGVGSVIGKNFIREGAFIYNTTAGKGPKKNMQHGWGRHIQSKSETIYTKEEGDFKHGKLYDGKLLKFDANNLVLEQDFKDGEVTAEKAFTFTSKDKETIAKLRT